MNNRKDAEILAQGRSTLKTKIILTSFVLLLLLGCLVLPCMAEESEMVWEEGKVVNIKDGDTFDVQLSTDIRTCRLVGIDTPEKFKGRKLNADVKRTGIRTIVHLEAGSQASEYANDYFKNRFTPEVWVHIMDTDLYGRDLCVVASKDTEPSIQGSYNCHAMLDGYAVYYKQGKNLKKIYRNEFDKCDIRDSGLWETFPVLMNKLGE